MDNICCRILGALLVFCLLGFRGVLVDVDHFIVPLQKNLPITLDNIITQGTRVLHFPILLADGLLALFVGSCLAGLLFDAIAVEAGCYKE